MTTIDQVLKDIMGSEEEYWEHILEKDEEEWLFDQDVWETHWSGVEHWEYDTKLITEGEKGFIMIQDFRKSNCYAVSDKSSVHLYFAFVAPLYRGQGVLRKLVKKMKDEYKNENIDLYSRDEITNKIWEKFGFWCVTRTADDDCDEYIYECNLTPDEISYQQLRKIVWNASIIKTPQLSFFGWMSSFFTDFYGYEN